MTMMIILQNCVPMKGRGSEGTVSGTERWPRWGREESDGQMARGMPDWLGVTLL